MRSRIRKALRRVGAQAALLREEEEIGRFTAVIQPDEKPGSQAASPSGMALPQRYILYGTGEGAALLAAGDCVDCGAARWYVHSCQPVYLRGKILYWRALVQREEGA